MGRYVLAVMILAACDHGGGPAIDAATDGTGDGPDAGLASLTCEEIAAQLQARAAATSRQCATPSDCMLDGYPVDFGGTPTCNCGATWSSSCGGDPVNAAAWAADATARALNAEWTSRCIGGTNGLCDCTRGTASCVEGTCRGTTFDCFNPPDAGVR
ncbi:MAG: hypothetical protein JNK64_19510 [Myxococcales bacterium]|nr:hypothetical protein [Myxococcales bacterium]